MEIKDILSLIEYKQPEGEELDLEKVKEHFEKNFVGINVATEKDEIKNIILGKYKGTHATALKNHFEALGVSFEGKDVKDDKSRLIVDKVMEAGIQALKDNIKELKESANKTDDKKAIELQGKLDKITGDYSIVTKERDELKSLVEKKESEFEGFKKNTILTEKIKSAKEKIQFTEKAIEFTKKGFDMDFHEKYNIELSDTQDSADGLRITNKRTNERISKGNKFVTYEDLYKTELAEAKLLKMADSVNNNRANERTPLKKFDANGKEIMVKINPRAQANAQQI